MAEEEEFVATVDELTPGQTRKFILRIEGSEEECFVVNYQGQLRAYVNRCCHVPMTMDWVDNQFFNEEKRFILCATHGACYEPESGECVSGPPFGEFLIKIPLSIVDGKIFALPPE